MHYWNDANFQGLLHIAGVLGQEPRLSELAEYCRQREKGRRREAFNALRNFLEESRRWDASDARSAVLLILELHAITPAAHQFFSQPLLEGFVFPVLETWLDAEPLNHSALRWLGLLRSDAAILTSALAQSTEDVPVRLRLIDLLVADVDYATHHLSEGLFLGDVGASRESLKEARILVATAPDASKFASVVAEIKKFEDLLDDWEAYRLSPHGTFPEWCKKRGRSYAWQRAIYYQ